MTESDLLIAPLMRILWQETRDRIHERLQDGEYCDIRAEHLAVLQYPGPDGERPSTLAARAGMSRQAINHLVGFLERAGYLERHPDPKDANARIIRLTDRGHAVTENIRSVAIALEREWAHDIGERRLEALRKAAADLSRRRRADRGAH